MQKRVVRKVAKKLVPVPEATGGVTVNYPQAALAFQYNQPTGAMVYCTWCFAEKGTGSGAVKAKCPSCQHYGSTHKKQSEISSVFVTEI